MEDGLTSHADVTKAIDFSYNAVQQKKKAQEEQKVDNFQSVNGADYDKHGQKWQDVNEDAFNAEEAKVMKMVKNVFADYFSVDSHGGKVARLEHGNLGLYSLGAEGKLTNGHAELGQANANGMDDAQIPVPVAASG